METINGLQVSASKKYFASLRYGGVKEGENKKPWCSFKAKVPTYLVE
ncbi:MAG: hypothetical protein MUF75_00845 [Bacteroidia bacterium]|nr:hypothetical protein [Bacteroidia bacterium]